MSRKRLTSRNLLPLLVSPWLLACGLKIGLIGDDGGTESSGSQGESSESNSAGEGSGSTDSSAGSTDTSTGGTDAAPNGLDILFVIDNSGSMSGTQSAMTAAAISLGQNLDMAGQDFRMAFTTTDNGNPWCPGTTPEAGALVYSSCRDRLSDFSDQAGQVDASEFGCTSTCTKSSAELGIDSQDPPWLERLDHSPDADDVAQTISCLFPQGINGCGFESPLEAMHKSLARMSDPGESAFGFIRDDANLLVVLVTDEVDCSATPAGAEIFEPSGNKAFWGDPDASTPTSAVCWNAGVRCTGPSDNMACTSASYNGSGQELDASNDQDAVLYPVRKYVNALAEIRESKQAQRSNAKVELAVIAGYAAGDELNYAESSDPQYMADFGVGAGCDTVLPTQWACSSDEDCTSVGLTRCGGDNRCVIHRQALPPVRMEAVRSSGASPYRVSVCAEDFEGNFSMIASEMLFE